VTSTIFGSTVGYPSDSLASCFQVTTCPRQSFVVDVKLHASCHVWHCDLW